MIAIHALMTPVFEVHHLDEWIQHHLNFGVDKIFIFNSGTPMYTTEFIYTHQNDKSLPAVRSQRERAYRNEKNQDIINDKWNSIIKSYTNHVTEVVLPTLISINKKTYVQMQNDLINDMLPIYRERKIDWVFNIDGDELLAGDINRLTSTARSVSRAILFQKVYDNIRVADSFSDLRINKGCLHPGFDFLKICWKNVVRPSDVKFWHDVHYKIDTSGATVNYMEGLYFEHYRGHAYKDVPNL